MLRMPRSPDYVARCAVAKDAGLVRPPERKAEPPTALQILDDEGLRDLSFVFFAGWLFTSIRNRSEELIRVSLIPYGPNRESSVLVLYDPKTHLASPSRRVSELFDPDYFECPLDRAQGNELSATQKHLCPVVNKLRYNLAHARSDRSVDGLAEPHRTQYCCESNKAKLWDYLNATIISEPEVYGPMVGGNCYPIRLKFSFLERFLTGTEPTSRDLGKLLEETLLWYAMAASGVGVGFAHVEPKVPINFNEIDLLLYDPGTDLTVVDEFPSGSWETYLSRHSVCMIELTVGHYSEVAKATTGPQKEETGAGKDVPKNKLMNYYAMRSFGFRLTHGNYFTILGESNLAPSTVRTLTTTKGFTYRCLSEECGDDVGQLVLNHADQPVPWSKIRDWHGRLIAMVEDAAQRFREGLSGPTGVVTT